MKYQDKIKYPKVGDEIIINRYSNKPYKIVSLKYKNFEQGDLVMGYEKGVHVVLGTVTYNGDPEEFVLLKRVFTDKLKPMKGSMSVMGGCIESARDFMLAEKKVHEEAIAIINQYTKGINDDN